MSILIKGMEMPDNCFHCSFCRNDLSSPSRLYVDCTATDSTIIECDYEDSEEAWRKLHDGRQELCPLIEVPTHHGRLIDADALDKAFTNMRWKDGDYRTGKLLHCGDRHNWCLNGGDIEELIQSAPTIIEEDGDK